MKDKPQLLHAIEMLLNDAEEIKLDALKYRSKFRLRFQNKKSEDEILALAVKDIVTDFSNKAALSGGATALTGVIPGIGTVIAAFGGTLADSALSMKFEVEMVMHLATLYGYDISTEDTQELCYVLAGLGVVVNAEGKGLARYLEIVKATVGKSQSNMASQVFKHVSMVLAKKALGKAIPLGIGVVISASANKKLTYSLGKNAIGYFQQKEAEKA